MLLATHRIVPPATRNLSLLLVPADGGEGPSQYFLLLPAGILCLRLALLRLLFAVSRERWLRLLFSLVRARRWSFALGLARVWLFRLFRLFGFSRRCWFWSFASSAPAVSFVSPL